MLHALLVLIGSSGRVVFEKEWVKTIAGVRLRPLPNTNHDEFSTIDQLITLMVCSTCCVVGVGRRQRATLYGGLLTTIQTLSKQSLAMHPSYIEYGQGTLPSTSTSLCAPVPSCPSASRSTRCVAVAVTVVLDADYEKTSMVCALFHDIDDVRLAHRDRSRTIINFPHRDTHAHHTRTHTHTHNTTRTHSRTRTCPKAPYHRRGQTSAG
jgi:hypothetical protein